MAALEMGLQGRAAIFEFPMKSPYQAVQEVTHLKQVWRSLNFNGPSHVQRHEHCDEGSLSFLCAASSAAAGGRNQKHP